LVTFGMVADLPPRSVCFPWKRAASVAHTKVIRAIGGCVCARNESSVEMDGLGSTEWRPRRGDWCDRCRGQPNF